MVHTLKLQKKRLEIHVEPPLHLMECYNVQLIKTFSCKEITLKNYDSDEIIPFNYMKKLPLICMKKLPNIAT